MQYFSKISRLCGALAIALAVLLGGILSGQMPAFAMPAFGNSGFTAENSGLILHVHQRKKRHSHRKKTRKKKKLRNSKRAKKKSKKQTKVTAWAKLSRSKDPVQLFVSIPKQQLTVFQGDTIIATSNISTGKPGYATPAGVFSILHKNRRHRSNIYGSSMPFMQRLTWSGIALHQSGRVPSQPASHGCIRLPAGFAGELFKYTNSGMHVVVANEDTKPYAISHPFLFNSKPAVKTSAYLAPIPVSAPVSTSAIKKPSKSARAPLRILVTRWSGVYRMKEIQAVLASLGYEVGKRDGYVREEFRAAIKRFKIGNGMEATSKATQQFVQLLYERAGLQLSTRGRIYVRQNFKPVLQAQIAIKGNEPLGTHMFIAMDFNKGAQDVRWRGVSLTKGTGKYAKKNSKQTSNAQQALSRIELSADTRARIEALLTPGSSLAISNDGVSRETSPKGSDFILLMQ